MNKSTERSALGATLGLIAGVVATGPMTVAMTLWHRTLPRSQRYPLPPREITMKLARKTGIAEEMNPEVRTAATFLAHFGYGGAAGALYGAIEDQIDAPVALKGVAFGLVLWAGSYLGLLPATGILKVATKHPAQRNILMIGAHIVWGAALGAVTGLLREEAQESESRPFSMSFAPHRDT